MAHHRLSTKAWQPCRALSTAKPYPPLSQAPTLPASWYHSREQYEVERARIFWTQWHCVGASCQLKEPREYLTESIAGWPIVVQRARDEAALSKESPSTTLRAFHNVCRHRAGPIALPQEVGQLDKDQAYTGKSSINGFRCRYHGWTYAESGELKGTPHFADPFPEGTPSSQIKAAEAKAASCDACMPTALPDFDKSDFPLYPIEVREELGLIWVRLHCDRALDMGMPVPDLLGDSPRVPEWEEAVGELRGALGEMDLGEFEFYSTEVHDLKCNWKTYVDNYSEGYHIFVCHPELDDSMTAQKDYRVEVTESSRCMKHVVPLKEDADAQSTGLWAFLFPNLAINVYGEGLSIERMMPVTPTSMRIKYTYMFKPGTTQQVIADSIGGSATLTEEDREIAEQVQRNLESGIYVASRYSPRHENGTYAFAKAVWENTQY